MKHFLAVSFTVLFCLPALIEYGQGNNIDSLKKVLQSQKEDTFRVKTLNALTYSLGARAEYTEAFKYGDEAIKLARKIKFYNGLAKAFHTIAGVYSTQTNNIEALKYYQMALEEYRRSGDNLSVGRTYINLGFIYEGLRNYQEAIKYCYMALKYFEGSGNKKWKGESYLMLSSLYNDQGNDTAALKNSLLGLTLKQEDGDKYGIAAAYGQVAYVHLTYGRFRQALENQLKALQIFKEKNDPEDAYTIGWTQHNIGFLYGKFGIQSAIEGNASQAKKYFSDAVSNCLDALKVYNQFKSTTDIAAVCGDLGSIYTNMGLFDSANSYLQSALRLSKESRNNFPLRETYKYLVELDSARGNYKQAFFNQKLYYAYRDSITNSENTNKLTQERVQFEYDKKETIAKAMQESKDADTRRIRNLQYTAIAFFLLLTLFLFLNNRQKQKAKTKIERAYSELRSAQSQLIQSEKMASLGQLTAGIAHEIQNPLNFVNNFSEINNELIEELKSQKEKLKTGRDELIEEDIINDIAANLQKIAHHGKRADAIVKGMLQHSRTSTGQKELTDINALADEYLKLAYHGLRAKDKDFNVTMKTDFDNSIDKINIIPQDIGRVLLNLYNNAFYAALLPPPGGGGFREPDGKHIPTVWVSTKKESGKVLIAVKDNGPGIPNEIIDKIFQPFFTTKPTGQGTGLGLSLSYDILKAHGGDIKAANAEDGGAVFIIHLPLA